MAPVAARHDVTRRLVPTLACPNPGPPSGRSRWAAAAARWCGFLARHPHHHPRRAHRHLGPTERSSSSAWPRDIRLPQARRSAAAVLAPGPSPGPRGGKIVRSATKELVTCSINARALTAPASPRGTRPRCGRVERTYLTARSLAIRVRGRGKWQGSGQRAEPLPQACGHPAPASGTLTTPDTTTRQPYRFRSGRRL